MNAPHNNPGKYDAACTIARNMTQATTVALIVIGGTHGSGFSVQTDDAKMLKVLPAVLEELAQQIRAQGAKEAS